MQLLLCDARPLCEDDRAPVFGMSVEPQPYVWIRAGSVNGTPKARCPVVAVSGR